ncbi:MAG: 50S ribosomal protein L22 [Phycisphaerales bacterium]|nr:50S ribosomal protein L22 [Phycisphaerales bacterium]
MAETVDRKESPSVWVAKHCFARIAPRKARLVMALIRGRRCSDALTLLQFSPQRAAVFIGKTLKSAMANANEAEAEMGRLFVSEARVDGGPIMKRWRPKDRGRAHPIQKKMSHLIVKVSER